MSNLNSVLKPAVIWFTGLSGAGKTTLSKALARILSENENKPPVLLDGDEIRERIKLTGFDEQSRKQHNLTVGYIASLFEQHGHIVIVSLISPYDDVRQEIRSMCSNFIEVYLSTLLPVCIARDPKGLYKKALAGEIKEFTGISAPYYPPQNPEITLDTSTKSVEECIQIIIEKIKASK